jgi:hypothetical protein
MSDELSKRIIEAAKHKPATSYREFQSRLERLIGTDNVDEALLNELAAQGGKQAEFADRFKRHQLNKAAHTYGHASKMSPEGITLRTSEVGRGTTSFTVDPSKMQPPPGKEGIVPSIPMDISRKITSTTPSISSREALQQDLIPGYEFAKQIKASEEVAPPPPPQPEPDPTPEAPAIEQATSQMVEQNKQRPIVQTPSVIDQVEGRVEGLAGDVQGNPNIPEPVKDAFITRMEQLQVAMQGVRQDFATKWDDAQQQFADEKARTEWMQVAELIGHALIQAGAAWYGIQQSEASGLPINLSNLQLQATDWDKKIDRSLAELQQKRIAIGEAQKEAMGGIEAELKEVGRTYRTEQKLDAAAAEAERTREFQKSEKALDRNLRRELAQLQANVRIMAAAAGGSGKGGKLSEAEKKELDSLHQNLKEVRIIAADKKAKDVDKVKAARDYLVMAGMNPAEIAQFDKDVDGKLWMWNVGKISEWLRKAQNRVGQNFGVPRDIMEAMEQEIDADGDDDDPMSLPSL